MQTRSAVNSSVRLNETKLVELPVRHRFSSVADPASDPHLNGTYYRNNPTWHVEYSPWKAENIHRLLERRQLSPKVICEVGCGAGEVLRQLQLRMDPECRFFGYDVAEPAIRMAKQRENQRLHFELADFGEIETPAADLILALEVVDHVEDYMRFLRMLKTKPGLKLFSFSLDLSAQNVLRKGALLERRELRSHLHHFHSETALAVLRDTGHEVLETSYHLSPAFSTRAKLARPVRQLAYKLFPDFTRRIFGGYSLSVLTR